MSCFSLFFLLLGSIHPRNFPLLILLTRNFREIKVFFFIPSHLLISATNNHDPWNGLATLMTLLETIVDTNKDYLSIKPGKGKFKRSSVDSVFLLVKTKRRRVCARAQFSVWWLQIVIDLRRDSRRRLTDDLHLQLFPVILFDERWSPLMLVKLQSSLFDYKVMADKVKKNAEISNCDLCAHFSMVLLFFIFRASGFFPLLSASPPSMHHWLFK